ncbi:unnamed protein product [Calypogeia fissa]
MAGRLHNGDRTMHDSKGRLGGRPWKNCWSLMKTVLGKRWLPVFILLICLISYFHRMNERPRFLSAQNEEHKFWSTAPSLGWRSSCAQRSSDWVPPRKSNGYLVVSCNGGFTQQRVAICNAVLAARIMNATLVLPQLDNSFWRDESAFPGIYDVDYFITTLKNDVRVVKTLPTTWGEEQKRIRLNPFQLSPPRNASAEWYETTALEKMKEHGAIQLTPFSHHLAVDLDNQEYQRLRCRVNYHALRFTNDIRNLTSLIVERLRSEGPYMSIHLRFETDVLALAGCPEVTDITDEDVLKRFAEKESYADEDLESSKRRSIGDCPLTPREVGLFLLAMGFDNSTLIYLAGGKVDNGSKSFLDPLRAMFPLLETLSTVAMPAELALVNEEAHGLVGPAVDYMVCLLSDIFIPTYDGPSEFANNLIGQRLYYGFRTTLLPDRKALVPLFTDFQNDVLQISDLEASVRKVMSRKSSGGPHSRDNLESFYTNPWPECFCSRAVTNGSNHCPVKADTSNLSYDEDLHENLADWYV